MILIQIIPIVYAEIPLDTPKVYVDPRRDPHYSELTIDINPKYWVIREDTPLNWSVVLRVDVLESNHINKIAFALTIEDESYTPNKDIVDGTLSIYNSSGDIVGTLNYNGPYENERGIFQQFGGHIETRSFL